MTQKLPIILILEALKSAEKKWPNWVDDPIHAASIISEEAGELAQAANDFCYGDGTMEHMIEEAAQVGAMAIRFLDGVGGYERVRRFLE